MYSELPPLDDVIPTQLAGRNFWSTKTARILAMKSRRRSVPARVPLRGAGQVAHRAQLLESIGRASRAPKQEAERRRRNWTPRSTQRLASLGIEHASTGRVLRGPFPDTSLRFAIQASDADKTTGKVTLSFGAHLPGAPAIFPAPPRRRPPLDVRVRATERRQLYKGAARDKALAEFREQFLMDPPVLAYANVTDDGPTLGLIAIANGSLWFEAATVARMYERVRGRHLRGHRRRARDQGRHPRGIPP